jgi:hypothetical protein
MGMRNPHPKRDPQLETLMIGVTRQVNGIVHWFGPVCKTSRRRGRLLPVSQSHSKGHAPPHQVVA